MPIPEDIKPKTEAFSPIDNLRLLAKASNLSVLSEEFSRKLDEFDIWSSFRSKFNIPKIKDVQPGFLEKYYLKLTQRKTNIFKYIEFFQNQNDNEPGNNYSNDECIYLCGHSLGLQPTETKGCVTQLLESWAKL